MRVEHLLQQNNQLLTHVQKLMVELDKLQSLQMAQLIASGVQLPPPPPSSTTPAASSSSPVPSSSLPAIPETSSNQEPSIAAIVDTPPTETPPPPPETTPTNYGALQLESPTTTVTTTSTSSSTTVTTTDSESLPTPFDLPVETTPLVQLPNEHESSPLIQPDDQESSPRTSTPVAMPTESPVDEVENERVSPFLTDTNDLPTNDPFVPQ